MQKNLKNAKYSRHFPLTVLTASRWSKCLCQRKQMSKSCLAEDFESKMCSCIGAGGNSLMFTLFLHLSSCLHVVITSKCCKNMMDMVCTLCQSTLQNVQLKMIVACCSPANCKMSNFLSIIQ